MTALETPQVFLFCFLEKTATFTQAPRPLHRITCLPESFLKPQFTLRDLLTKRECHKEVGGLSRLRRASRFSRTEFFASPQDTMTEQALEALSASLGTRKPEPELDLSSIKEVDEVLTWGLTYKAC